MSIYKHHARNARRTLFVAIIVWVIIAIGFVVEYRKGTVFSSEKDTLKSISIMLSACILLIYGLIERSRAKGIEQVIQDKEISLLLEQRRFVIRRETGIFKTVTYFGLDGNTIGVLKERYNSQIQKIWKCILSFFFKGMHEQQFYLCNELGEELLIVKKKRGIRNSYSFHSIKGEKIGELNQLLSLTKWEWCFLSVDGQEVGKITGDLSATMQKGKWQDGTYIDVKEDGIPLEAVQYFSASGGSLVSISVSEHADFEKAVYYAVTTIITFKN
ncbi:sugar ABC transporter ATP-binding protein [Bacillus pseudomycoides]|uniref:sugar ABC transporter ATP-binding protein n=1 Tax=Bacillus pseudomycoides TaxID=64104 RepID=UPI000BED4DE9|nr:sugar ABC transporter ATP-binding protein [Bacillus pseudomycoides]PEE42444.1 sugar ABC transporter ATP-binding protein [Bacillus pseudomycoides]PGA92242.1 sugar ABC transporter ATP-binding protein [Bacillus pseudomycoides]